MDNKILSLKEKFVSELDKIDNLADIESIRVSYLGKKGSVTDLLKGMKELSNDERKAFGQKVNELKGLVNEKITEKTNELKEKEIQKEIELMPEFDLSMPPVMDRGSYHPITLVQRECERIFKSMGFTVEDYSEIVTDYECFESLNIPKHHPARDMQDTYYLTNGQLLKSQTSAAQNAIYKKYRDALVNDGVPIKAIFPGRCFRNEATDACHENTFFQMEGVMVDKNISISNLIYFMKTMLSEVFQKDIFNRTIYAGEGVGSGVLIDNEGHIVTNNHVVSGASNGEVTVSLSDGTTVKGTVMGTDEQSDLAVVKIDPPKNIQPVAIGDSDSLQVGEPAIAIGNPLGLEFKGSVTSGVISALARTIDDQGQRFPLIQTDAAINPGNSGGALINADGELIGINSAKISKEGIEGMGFAIPINSAMTIVDSIIKNGKVVRPYIGVWAVDRQTAARNNVSYEGEGLLIVQLDANGPAAQAGLVEGDTIAQIDGKDITTLLELKEQIDAKSPGDIILISYTHNGKMKSAQLKLGEASSN